MHIGINAHLLAFTANYREAGLSKHIRDLVASLLEQDKANRYTIFVGSGAAARPADYARSPRAQFSVSRWPTRTVERKASMLTSTFCHLPGVGPKTERKLWAAGYLSWRAR